MNTRALNLLGVVIGIGLLVSLATCNSDETSAAKDIQNTMPEKNLPTDSMTPEKQIAFSKGDLAKHRSIEPDSITVAEIRQVTWRSGALGCPKPDMNYSQALVQGFLIQLKVDDEIIAYHAKKDGIPFHCPSDQAEGPVSD